MILDPLGLSNPLRLHWWLEIATIKKEKETNLSNHVIVHQELSPFTIEVKTNIHFIEA
jgi:hypothetical protein